MAGLCGAPPRNVNASFKSSDGWQTGFQAVSATCLTGTPAHEY